MKTKNSKNVCVSSLCCILLTYNTDSIMTHASDYSFPINNELSDSFTTSVRVDMVPSDEYGNPLPDSKATSYFDCGSATIIASRDLVTVKIHQTMGWILWDFTGEVDDTLGDDYYIYQYNIGRNSFVETFTLDTPGLRTLTLSGTARDVSGLQYCTVLPGTFINHDSTERA